MPVNGKNITTDEILIRKCIAGEEKYCRQLFEQFYGRMLNVCRRYAKDNDEAFDLLQEGFIRVFKNLKQYSSQGSFEGWIRRIMVTTSINYYRKHHQNGKVDYMENNVLTSFEQVEEIPAYSGADADELLKMVQQLPPMYRSVFNLYAIEGFSHAEISTMLDISESTSRSNLAKARQKLQHILLSYQLVKSEK